MPFHLKRPLFIQKQFFTKCVSHFSLLLEIFYHILPECSWIFYFVWLKKTKQQHQRQKTTKKKTLKKLQILMEIFTLSLRKQIDKQIVLKQCGENCIKHLGNVKRKSKVLFLKQGKWVYEDFVVAIVINPFLAFWFLPLKTMIRYQWMHKFAYTVVLNLHSQFLNSFWSL